MKFVDHDSFKLADYCISADEYLLKMKEHPKPIVLDIREKEVYLSGTIENAYNLPYSEFAERLIQLPPFGTIIIYSDEKNQQIDKTVKLLWENGFSDIFYVDKGYQSIVASLFEVSDDVLDKCIGFLKENNAKAIKLNVAAYELGYDLVNENPDPEEYKEVVINNLIIYFSHRKLRLVEGTIINWQDGKPSLDHPRLHQERPKESLKERVQKLLDQQVNPSVASHGGYVKLIDVKDDVAYIEMMGGCKGCGQSAATLKNGIEAAIFHGVPEISQVLDTTDHASGTNPYYQSDANA